MADFDDLVNLNTHLSKEKWYYHCKFPSDVIKTATALFLSKIDKPELLDFATYKITKNYETWNYTSIDEFLVEYPNATSYRFFIRTKTGSLLLEGDENKVQVHVDIQKREDIHSIFQKFEENLDRSVIKTNVPIKIFIGHGNNPIWKDLKDHLHEKHSYDVEAYEIGPRSGLTVKEVLEFMLTKSSFACLVLTGEDLDNYGEIHARENVIHELGLFQGRLGFRKAIILKEDGVKEFSNIYGVNQIRFSKNNIKETFGEILATIKREFEENNNQLPN